MGGPGRFDHKLWDGKDIMILHTESHCDRMRKARVMVALTFLTSQTCKEVLMAKLHSITDCPPLPEVEGVEFRHCPGHVGFAAGSNGTIWSCWKRGGRRKHRVRIMDTHWTQRVACPDTGGYPTLVVPKTNGVNRTRMVHQMILEAFVGPKPPGMECCHENGVRTDNRIEKLRWDTRSNNQKDSVRHGTSYGTTRGENAAHAKLSADDVTMIRTLFRFLGCNRVARIYDISPTHAKDINARRARTEVL